MKAKHKKQYPKITTSINWADGTWEGWQDGRLIGRGKAADPMQAEMRAKSWAKRQHDFNVKNGHFSRQTT